VCSQVRTVTDDFTVGSSVHALDGSISVRWLAGWPAGRPFSLVTCLRQLSGHMLVIYKVITFAILFDSVSYI
jgi:hypothetical protein